MDVTMWSVQYLVLYIIYTGFLVSAHTKPNIVILFGDDIGYGDLEVYGHPTSSTPNLNKLAAEGMRFTQFYVSGPVCSPSRAGLLTGRYQTRSGVYPGVFEARDIGGLPLNETTIAEMLKPQGYQSAIIGKWHLGVGKDGMYLPTHQGFDHYYGIPFSQSDCLCVTCFYPEDPCHDNCQSELATCPLFNDTTIVEQPVDLTTLTERYTKEAKEWIDHHARTKEPFFLYMPFQHAHYPQFASKQFRNSTQRGTFGDSLAEMDWSVGQIIEQLHESGVAGNTFVFFTSDNGPSLLNQNRGGNAGPLKCGKGTTYEGGQREPAIAYWPGHINPGGRSLELASSLDLLPTIAKITDVVTPNVTLDGYDMSPILFKEQPSLRKVFYYYPEFPDTTRGVYAIRYKHYKAHFYTTGSNMSGGMKAHDIDCRIGNLKQHNPPLLFDLNLDPSEQHDMSTESKYSGLLHEISTLKSSFDSKMEYGLSQISRGSNINLYPCCSPKCNPFPHCCQCSTWDRYSALETFLSKVTNK